MGQEWRVWLKYPYTENQEAMLEARRPREKGRGPGTGSWDVEMWVGNKENIESYRAKIRQGDYLSQKLLRQVK